MSIVQSFFSYLNSYATTITYPTQLSKHYGASAPVVPLFLLHTKNANQAPIPVTGGAVVDTGAESTVLNQKYAKLIGIDDLKKGGLALTIGGSGGNLSALYYEHKIKLRIGNLQPVTVPVAFGPHLEEDHVIGRSTLREYIITLTQQQIRVTDYAKTAAAKTKAAYAHAYHAALMNAGNSQARYRNRI
jgi:hypothetical protein